MKELLNEMRMMKKRQELYEKEVQRLLDENNMLKSKLNLFPSSPYVTFRTKDGMSDTSEVLPKEPPCNTTSTTSTNPLSNPLSKPPNIPPNSESISPKKVSIDPGLDKVASKVVKKIVVEGVKSYDGNTDFEVWYKVFNTHMNIASAPPDVRSISLFSLLSPTIQKTMF